MNDYKRITKACGFTKDLDLSQEYGYMYIYQRLAELENKIENGKLVDTSEVFIKPEEIYRKKRFLICTKVVYDCVVDFANTQKQAEKKIKELKGEK